MNYLLLGGAGFIGSHLHSTLLNRGHNVVSVDRNPSKLPGRHVHSDILDASNDSMLDSLIRWADVVYFMAGTVGVEYVVNNPKNTMDNNLALAMKLIPLFEKHQPHVVFTSTSEVYGNGPFVEGSGVRIGDPTNLRWSYAASKAMIEFMINASSFSHTILRFFNIVGPGQIGDHGMVIPRFIQAAKRNAPIIVHGTGDQIRSFCHVSDAIDIMLSIDQIHGEVFNVGNDTPTTINDLARVVVDVVGSSSPIRHVPLHQIYTSNYGDIQSRIPDLTKLRNTITVKYQYSLTDIIRGSL